MVQSQGRRRDGQGIERQPPPRRIRRRRQSAPWLQRNALSVAALSILVAMLGVGFGLLQMLNRPEAGPGSGLATQIDATASASGPTIMNATSLGPSVPVPGAASNEASAQPGLRPIQTNARVIDANYTIAAGDTLVQIAAKFNTTVQRIQAFNNLADPRALRIGNKLVIPPPL